MAVDSELTITPLSYDKDLKQFSVSVAAGEQGMFIVLSLAKGTFGRRDLDLIWNSKFALAFVCLVFF